MRYLSVCSGIEAATVAWHPLGWTPAAFSEIEAFPRAVLAHHYPSVPCHGDFTTIGADDYGPIDLLVGGTPCQSFSIAGLRGGIHDERGNLALEFLRLLDRKRPRWVVWENVPGVFSATSHDAPDFSPPAIDLGSGDAPQDGETVVVEDSYDSDESHAFACFLAGLSECGYGLAYRILDAQFAGVAQRRRRVFVVGYLGDWRRAAAVLFERHSLQGHPAPRREKGQSAPTIPSRSTAGGGLGTDFDCDGGLIAPPLTSNPYGDHESREGLLTVTHSLRAEGFDASEDGTGRGTPLVPVAYQTSGNCGAWETGEITGALDTNTDPNSHVIAFNLRGREDGAQAEADPDDLAAMRAASGGSSRSYIAFSAKDHGADAMDDCSPTLRAGGHSGSHANAGVMPAVAFTETADCLYAAMGTKWNGNAAATNGSLFAKQASAVRRLTPRECEKLQGFEPDYTLVPYRGKPAADGPRYKALGNSMAVPCMLWLGQRIQMVEDLTREMRDAA